MGLFAGYGLLTVLSLFGFLYLKKRKREWRYRNYLLMTAAMGAACLLAAVADGMGKEGQEGIGEVERNQVGQGTRDVQLKLTAEDVLKEYTYPLAVEEQQATAAEAERLFELAREELERVILGENPAAEEISAPLSIPRTLTQGAVEVTCTFDPLELVNMDGTIAWESLTEETALVKASAKLICQGREALHEFYLRLVTPPRTGEEALLKEVGDRLRQENESQGKMFLTLPEESGGVPLHWSLPREETHLKVLFFGCACMVAWYVYGKEKRNRQQKAWDNQLVLDYPDIVSQLSLLSGAGMTIPAAWGKLALEYRDRRGEGRMFLRPGYEEMLKTWYEMQDGTGELKAYENFGRRCDNPQYRKFASLLIQNIRKGTRGMQALLDAEAEEAFQNRKAHARKLGEEAGTKLLMPMGLMLLLVFAILLMPAMMSMGV